MKTLFNEERLIVAKIMKFDSELSWVELHDKMAKSIMTFDAWLSATAEEQEIQAKSLVLLSVVREFTYYETTGTWSNDGIAKTRARLHRRMNNLFLNGYFHNLERADLDGVVDDDLLETYSFCKQ